MLILTNDVRRAAFDHRRHDAIVVWISRHGARQQLRFLDTSSECRKYVVDKFGDVIVVESQPTSERRLRFQFLSHFLKYCRRGGDDPTGIIESSVKRLLLLRGRISGISTLLSHTSRFAGHSMARKRKKSVPKLSIDVGFRYLKLGH